jgi:hypothetical protein
VIVALLLRISDDARRPAPDPSAEILATPAVGVPVEAGRPGTGPGDDEPTVALRRTSGGGRP